MDRWDAEPLWQWWQRMTAPRFLHVGEALALGVEEDGRAAGTPAARGRTGFRGLDIIRSKLGQGQSGYIVSLPTRGRR
jgi:hypothetical protein